MSALTPFLVIDQTCEQVQAWVNQQLANADLRVVQTFDLQVARLAHPDCSCPNHGTDECNCQLIILLIYQRKGDPAALVIHGQEGKSWLSLVAQSERHTKRRLETAIQRALKPKPSNILPLAEVAYENAESTS